MPRAGASRLDTSFRDEHQQHGTTTILETHHRPRKPLGGSFLGADIGVSAPSLADLVENLQDPFRLLTSKLLPVFVGGLVRPIG